ncbi:MAG: flagellar basal body-associated protein FliL [Methylocystis sp.]|nr:MAG: flagellar basal body-associated protein FliL [Methylocystis sp.]
MARLTGESSTDSVGGFLGIAMIFACLTLLGAGAGAALGFVVLSSGDDRKPRDEHPPGGISDEHGHKGDSHPVPSVGDGSTLVVRELPAIVVNLAAPERSWIRLQSAIVYDPSALPHPDELIVNLMSDATAFLRTLSLAELEGADGLRRLQEDLGARAATRSRNRLKEFVIESLVVQ